MFHIFRTTYINVLRGLPKHLKIFCNCTSVVRSYADTSKSESKSNRVPVKIQGTDTEPRLRVRIARPSDVPRILRFVREHSRVWPGPLTPQKDLVLTDYVARTLAQGHSIIAEQYPNTLRPEIHGLALGASLCPWDAALLERWATCLPCPRSKRLVNFSAYCLRAPMLHDKYQVKNILQIILIVPLDTQKNAEIVHILAKHAIKRGVDAGFQLLRFDATKDCITLIMSDEWTESVRRAEPIVVEQYSTFAAEQSLEKLMLKKEWSLSYQVIPENQTKDSQGLNSNSDRGGKYNDTSGKIVVFSALVKNNGGSSNNTGGLKPNDPLKTPVLAK